MKISTFLFLGTSAFAHAEMKADPLPSWNEGKAKAEIIQFVEKVTRPGPDFVAADERIATFDNDGTLWQEHPLAQGAFLLTRLKALVKASPELLDQPEVKAAIEGDLDYFKEAGLPAVMKLLALTHANLTQEDFDAEADEFFSSAMHPTLHRLYKDLTYQPMLELMRYLRNNGFKTFICSGGGTDFIRRISSDIYDIPKEQVIGSTIEKSFVEQDGSHLLKRLPKLGRINDKDGKPIGIDLQIGNRPIFAAGNVKSGGDIAMLTYSQERKGLSLQVLVDHDDADREFSYSEPDNASLDAAAAQNWSVVSMKQDWRVIFPTPTN